MPPLMLAPGSTIGILGGGQLGRMTAMAAARLGYRSHVFTPEEDSPCAQVTPMATLADFGDEAALARFAAAVDVVTFEFENIPAEATDFLIRQGKAVYPSPEVLRITQERLREKDFLGSIGVATTAYRPVTSVEALAAAIAEIGPEAVLKTVRMGYDGKGQAMLRAGTDLGHAWERLGASICILEGFIDFACEISVIVARGMDGAVEHYPVVENRHAHHILDTTTAPARVAPEIAARAEAIACHIARSIGLVGVLAVEMFVTRDGSVLVNELAPRPHNSGHWTIDACHTSQFEQLVRAICGLPLGSPERHSDAVMKNLIGADAEKWAGYLSEPTASLHLYGKLEARPGRKMGHVTWLSPKS